MFSMAVGRRIIHASRSRRLSEKYVSVSVNAEMDWQSGRARISEGTRKNSASKILRLSPRPEPSPTIGTALNGDATFDFCPHKRSGHRHSRELEQNQVGTNRKLIGWEFSMSIPDRNRRHHPLATAT